MYCTIPSPTTRLAGAQPPTANPVKPATSPPSPSWSDSFQHYSSVGNVATLTARLDGLSTDKSPEDLSKTLGVALEERELYKCYLSSLVGDEKRVKGLLEVFDKALTNPKHDAKIFKKFRQLCGRTGSLPASHIISENLIRTSEEPVASGGYGDIWEGIYNDKRVAIKALRVYKDDDLRKVSKVFCKEVVMWKRVSHPNIVPFLGVSEAPAPLSMVSEWMPNGNVRSYIAKNPEISRLQLLLDISNGLSYLHSLEIVHGDLKGDNILVDGSGRARLNDFGFTSIAALNCTETSASGFKGSTRWMAPELFGFNDGASGLSTRQSDVFALGMVTFEVFTGQVPFSENRTSAIVTKRIVDGERPQRPPKGRRFGLSDQLWEVVQSSLAHKVEERPPVPTFVEFLEGVIPDIAVLEKLTEFDANSEKHVQELRRMFGYADNTLFGMREEETLIAIEVFDRVLNSSLNDPALRSMCLRGLQKISARCGLLPKSYWISHSILAEPDGTPSTGGVSSTCQRLMDGKLVAVKAISPDCVENLDTFKRKLWTNGIMWKRLRHPNVVPFLGFGSVAPPFSLVYPWMSNESLSEYVCENPDADKLGLLLGLARGLAYLHKYNIVHGNLTGNNILVDGDGVACISEYGLDGALLGEHFSKPISTNVRWMAPEVLSAESGGKRAASADDGKRADVYSFAVVMFEVFSGATAFPRESDEEIKESVTLGMRPEWPPGVASQGLGDAIWEQVEACWSHEPEERPTSLAVLQALQELSEEPPQESQGPLETPGDETWEHVEDIPEYTPSSSNERSIFSGSTLENNSIGRYFVSSRHGGSSPSKHGSSESHRTRVKQRVRHLLHLPEHGPVTVKTVEGPKSETIIDQREEVLRVSNDSVPYLVSQPIPAGKTLKKVVVTVISKDQGWSSHQGDHGTYQNSWTWFELSVGSDSGERWRGEVVRNLHAHGDFKEHTIEISDGELYEKAKSGDILTVWALAKFSGWKNTVKKVKIRYEVE